MQNMRFAREKQMEPVNLKHNLFELTVENPKIKCKFNNVMYFLISAHLAMFTLQFSVPEYFSVFSRLLSMRIQLQN